MALVNYGTMTSKDRRLFDGLVLGYMAEMMIVTFGVLGKLIITNHASIVVSLIVSMIFMLIMVSIGFERSQRRVRYVVWVLMAAGIFAVGFWQTYAHFHHGG
jgi:hypothetical protein